MQYFQIKLNFSIKDQSHMFVLAGICGMFTQLILLRLLLRYISKRDLLLVGVSSSQISFSLQCLYSILIGSMLCKACSLTVSPQGHPKSHVRSKLLIRDVNAKGNDKSSISQEKLYRQRCKQVVLY